MKLVYVANIRLPTEKAHGIQIMKMCEAFAILGFSVELVVPRRINWIKENPFDYYEVKKLFSIYRLPCFDLVRFGKLGFWVQSLSFSVVAVGAALFKGDPLFYTRNEMVAFCLSCFGKKVIWEGHMGNRNFFINKLLKNNVNVVAISGGLKNLYISCGGNEKKIFVAPDAVDLQQFNLETSKEEAKKATNLSSYKKIALYAGHLYSWKGANTVAQAARDLSKDIQIIFVGGTEKDIKIFQEVYGSTKNISFVGKRPHKDIPLYLKSADILLLPNSGREEISRFYTSPLKLFEYMASGVPIIASDLPSLKEIIDDRLAYFFEPDNSKGLVATIDEVFANTVKAKEKAHFAFQVVQKYSWHNRAESIINFFKLNHV